MNSKVHVLTCTTYMGKLEISVGKSKGSHHSISTVSENMGCDLRRCSLIFYSFQ